MTLRRCQVSDEEPWDAYFHFWTVDTHGKAAAMVEDSDGEISYVAPHKVKFEEGRV